MDFRMHGATIKIINKNLKKPYTSIRKPRELKSGVWVVITSL
jgi:hypothetical protein